MEELKQTEKHSSAKKSLALSFYTFLSRILGLIRDHYMAVSFGTGMVASAFSVAYRLPNMFRNLLAEGTLSQSFMPLYSESGKISEEEAKIMSGAVITFLASMLLIFVGIFVLLAPYLLPLLVGGGPEYYNLVIELSLILFILIFTASLSSIYMAISNSMHKFFVPSLSPIILNLSYLFVFILIFPFIEETLTRVRVLSFGIVTGGFLQLLVQSFYIYKLGYAPRLNLNWKHPSIRKIGSLMLPAIIGGGFYQISLLVDVFLANYIQNQNPGLGAVVSLDYSQRLIQLPTGIIGVALATTTLPSLLLSLKENKHSQIPQDLAHTICFSLYLTIPAALGFMLMGETIIDSIFYGGKWDHAATKTTLAPLLFYSAAIPSYSLNKILTSSFYAFKDTKTPLRINMISFSMNIIMNLLLMNFFKHAGLAFASAISANITLSLLFYKFRIHDVEIPIKLILKKILSFLVPILGLSIWLVLIESFLTMEFISEILPVSISYANLARVKAAIGIVPSIFIYFFLSKLLKLEEFEIIFGRIIKKLLRK